ncbi:hypothetical protein [Brevibacillus reuszeri]|uniref:hypothetical protein n=1 Tax=Brevibacillus reuszeri TaxID=54915 RepID=UPI000CCC7D12|nr:hypothetical protein [Brevibacillus reuszeri]
MKSKWIYLITFLVMLNVAFINANPVQAYQQKECDNNSTKWYCSDWYSGDFEYEEDSDSIGGDYQLNYDGAGVYYWEIAWDEILMLSEPRLWVHLNESKFRADAMYMVLYDDSGFGAEMIGSIDQNTAPGGWSYIGRGDSNGTGSEYTTIYVYALGGDDNLGADAIRVRENY